MNNHRRPRQYVSNNSCTDMIVHAKDLIRARVISVIIMSNMVAASVKSDICASNSSSSSWGMWRMRDAAMRYKSLSGLLLSPAMYLV